MSQESAVQEQPGTDQGSQQDDYGSDVFEKYTTSHEEFLDEDLHGKRPVVAQKKPVENPVQKKAETPKENLTATEKIAQTKGATETDPLESAFTGKDGQFDLQKFTSFALPQTSNIPEEKGIPQKSGEKPQEEIPEWKKAIEQDRTEAEAMRKVIGGVAENIRQLIASGNDPEAAIQAALQDHEKKLNDYLQGQSLSREEARMADLDKRVQDREKAIHINADSRTNTNSIIQGLPGKTFDDKKVVFDTIMFGKDTGAQILLRELYRKHPEARSMSQEQVKPLTEKFISEEFSDRENLQYLFERAFDRTMRLKMPALMERQRMMKAAEIKTNALAAQKRPAGTSLRKPAATGGSDPFENYRNHHIDHV
jgi:hypothetical protein